LEGFNLTVLRKIDFSLSRDWGRLQSNPWFRDQERTNGSGRFISISAVGGKLPTKDALWVGSYQRRMPVSLDRMYENALDWAHLPFLHQSSFASIELIEAGDWGWRPGVPLDQKARVGAGYQKLYQGLYDEDEAMMLGRQAALDQKAAKTPLVSEALDLGPVEAVLPQHPLDFDFNGQRWRLVKDRGEFIVYSLTCPHQLGSFVDEALIDGSITCPWHGYRFDVRSGHCLSGHACKLPAPPTVMVRGEKLYAMLAD